MFSPLPIVLSLIIILHHFYYVPRETITLKQVLDWMDTGAPFSIAFVTCDRTRKKGGEWIEIENVRKHEFITSREKARLAKAQPRMERISKDPRHYENSTRNLQLQNAEIRKVHIRLIRKFNGKVVV